MVLKIFVNIIKICWLILGAIILLWTGFWYYKTLTIGEIGGVIATTLLMGMGFYALLFYVPITIVLVIIYLVLKKKKKI